MNSSKNPLYYNLSIINGYDSPRALSPSVIEELNNQVIVEKGTQMYMTVGRFSIPTSTIPYLIVPIQLGQADINKTQYSIQFKICTAFGVFNETFTQTLSVPFLSQYPLLAPTITPPLITQDVKNSYYWSSTENGGVFAYYYGVSSKISISDSIRIQLLYVSKNYVSYVRAVRSIK